MGRPHRRHPLASQRLFLCMNIFSKAPSYFLTRLAFQRALAFVYLVAFVVTAQQFKALIGHNGLLPARLFVEHAPFWQSPSIFFWNSSDLCLALLAWAGVGVSFFALTGYSERFGKAVSALTWFFLWAVYLSFVNIGQTWYSFGWETMLCEAGFLCIFLGSSDVRPPTVMIWMLRWMLFRTMLGAGLIKLRGDACWRDLTCLQVYFETQPVPNLLSAWFHHLPAALLKMGVLFNHFVELALPFGFFISGPVAVAAGLATALFQLILIVSGNLSFLNYFTIALCIPCLDDRFLSKVIRIQKPILVEAGPVRSGILVCLSAVIVLLSIPPTMNLLSKDQVMNTSYDPFRLVNTYGMFGGVTHERFEVIVEGTEDRLGLSTSDWKEYEFFAKPGDPNRRPPLMAPYHRRLDWLMWFAAMGPWQYQPWFLNFTAKLLENDKDVLSLLRKNPFPDAPPQWVRATLYRYHFATSEEHRKTGAYWVRERARPFFPAVRLDEPSYRAALREMGWTRES